MKAPIKKNEQSLIALLDFIIEQKEKIVVCCDKVDRLSRNIFDKRISILYERAFKRSSRIAFYF